MKKAILILSLFLLYGLTIHSVNGQNIKLKNKYSQQDLEKNKIYDQVYNLWQYKNRWISNKNDTLAHPFFVDDRNYKGLINYGVVFRSKDYRTFDFTEGLHMYFLEVDFEKVLFNPKDSTMEIEGYISGGWGDLLKKEQIENGTENRIDVFLGEKTDTIKYCYYGKVVNEEFIEVKLNNREIDETTILDTFPAFYFKNASHNRFSLKGRCPFKIRGKITNNTLLAFGGKNCYSEIFDLGAMVYYPDKNKRKKIKQSENLPYKTLINNNRRLADVENEKANVKDINYYTFTEEAENFILKRQYAKAKERYMDLNKKYPVLFARDIHNAIRCALLTRDYENTFYWAEKLAIKGVKINYFDANIFNALKKNKQWKSFSTRYDSVFKENQKSKNYRLKEQIEKLVQEDQSDYGLADRKESRVLYETTERVTGKLIELLKKEGYPSEEKIGVYIINDTLLIPSPEYHVLIRHAIQQRPNNLKILEDLLEKSLNNLEYDSKRSPNNVFQYNSCFHVYGNNLYSAKSCGSNDFMVQKMKFIFNNPYNFLIHTENYVVIEYDKDNPEELDRHYKENFNLIMKLNDNWKF